MDIDEVALQIEEAGNVLDESGGTDAEKSEETGEDGAASQDREEEATDAKEEEEGENKEAAQIPEGPTASEIAKLEAKIELMKENQPDVKEFYSNLDEYLSEEEQALRFEDDQSAYIEAVEAAKKRYLSERSNEEEVARLEAELAEKKRAHQIVSAIAEVVEKYPDFDYKTVGDFVMNDLSRREQQELEKGKTSAAEYMEAAYRKWKERNPGKVETKRAPNIPDVDKMRKNSGDPTPESFGDEDSEYLAAVGFAKK